MNWKKLKFNKLHIQALRDICNWYGIEFEVNIVTNQYDTAYATLLTDKIVINIRRDSEVPYFYTLFFHELAHIQNKYTKKYPLYHCYDPLYFNKKEQSNFLRTVTRAELYTDKVGKQLLKAYFPDIPYINSYTKTILKTEGSIMVEEFRNYFQKINQNRESIKKTFNQRKN